MDLKRFEPCKGVWYWVSANYGSPDTSRGTLDIRRRFVDGLAETVRQHVNAPGDFPTEIEAR